MALYATVNNPACSDQTQTNLSSAVMHKLSNK